MTGRSKAKKSTVPLTEVVIPKGRRPLGDIKDLTASIKEVGLINPITLTGWATWGAEKTRFDEARGTR